MTSFVEFDVVQYLIVGHFFVFHRFLGDITALRLCAQLFSQLARSAFPPVKAD